MIDFMVMAKNTDGSWEGLGSHSFRAAPQIGHFVTMVDKAGKSQAYQVITVMHPLDPATNAGDLILRHVGTDIELRKGL